MAWLLERMFTCGVRNGFLVWCKCEWGCCVMWFAGLVFKCDAGFDPFNQQGEYIKYGQMWLSVRRKLE